MQTLTTYSAFRYIGTAPSQPPCIYTIVIKVIIKPCLLFPSWSWYLAVSFARSASPQSTAVPAAPDPGPTIQVSIVTWWQRYHS